MPAWLLQTAHRPALGETGRIEKVLGVLIPYHAWNIITNGIGPMLATAYDAHQGQIRRMQRAENERSLARLLANARRSQSRHFPRRGLATMAQIRRRQIPQYSIEPHANECPCRDQPQQIISLFIAAARPTVQQWLPKEASIFWEYVRKRAECGSPGHLYGVEQQAYCESLLSRRFEAEARRERARRLFEYVMTPPSKDCA